MEKVLYIIAGCNGAGKTTASFYLPIVNETLIFDNSLGTPELVFRKTEESDSIILNQSKFDEIRKNR